MNKTKVVVPIADGTEEMEAVIIIDVLRRAGFSVVSASISKTKTICASRNVQIIADSLWQDINPTDFDAIILPGGATGTDNLTRCPGVIKALQDFNKAQKLVGAICAAPLTLQAANILADKQSTCHPAVAEELTVPQHSQERVTQSGNIITSQGPGTAMEFALAIIEYLASPRLASEVKSGLVM